MNEGIRALARTNAIPLVDLDLEMRPLDTLLKEDGAHWQPQAVKVKGDAIMEVLWDLLLQRWNISL